MNLNTSPQLQWDNVEITGLLTKNVGIDISYLIK